MTKIEQLKADIASIEESVNGEMSKEALYDSLIVAYMHQKDIIVLQQDLVPIKEDLVSKAALNDAEDTIKLLQEENTDLKEQVRTLQHWQDGASLEIEQLYKDIKASNNTLDTTQAELVTANEELEELHAEYNHIQNDFTDLIDKVDCYRYHYAK